MNKTEIDHIIKHLKVKLNQKLPGNEIRALLAPFINGVNQKQNIPAADSKRSAVLLLLGVKKETLQVVFTLRSTNLLSHSGQISFPGGKSNINEIPEKTALRETYEEIGILPRNIEILGKLSPIFVLPSNSHIFPIVGYSEKYLDFIINHDEVEEVFTKPLDFFTFNNIKQKKWEVKGEMIDIPYWSVHPSIPLWGATAMILAEFIAVYQTLDKIFI